MNWWFEAISYNCLKTDESSQNNMQKKLFVEVNHIYPSAETRAYDAHNNVLQEME